MKAGREGVRRNQVDAYGRIKLTDELKSDIISALSEELGITYTDKKTTSTKTIDGVEKTVETTTRTYKFSGVVISEVVVEETQEGN